MTPGAWKQARCPYSKDDVRVTEDIALPELSAAIRGCLETEDPLTEAAPS